MSDDLDEIMKNVDLTEKTELQGVADEMFSAGNTRTKISSEEVGTAFVTGIVFKALGMKKHEPTHTFLELKKSQDGFSTEKFVESVSGIRDDQSGRGFLNRFKDSMKPQ